MRLIRLTVENFRCYAGPMSIRLDELTALVGRNDVGKSALMDALAIFFETVSPDKQDACKSGDPARMRITCEFDDLPDEIVLDADFRTSLIREYLLNDRGNLEIRKTYNGALVAPKQSAVHALAMHPSAAGYDDLLTLKKADLTARAAALGVNLEAVNKQANAPIREAIWGACANLELVASEVQLDAEGGKQVATALAPYLPTFALFKSDRASTDQDNEAQDPLKARSERRSKQSKRSCRRLSNMSRRKLGRSRKRPLRSFGRWTRPSRRHCIQ